MNLRPYQIAAIESLREHLRQGKRRILLVAACGAGKTVLAASMIHAARQKSKHAVFVGHTREIALQTSAKLSAFGVKHSLVMSGEKWDRDQAVHVATIQTLLRREMPYADILFIDEAHRARSDSHQRLVGNYPGIPVIGLSGSPWRNDGRGLGELFESVVVAATPKELVAQGFLVPVTGYSYDNPELSGVRVKSTGDYDSTELGSVMRRKQLMGNIVAKWMLRAGGLRTLCFAVHVDHSKEIVRSFADAGVPAEHVDGETPREQRDAAIARLRRKQILVLSSVDIFVEGLDVPEAECLILARPTRSLSRYVQMAGRGRRPMNGKSVCRVHDHAGIVLFHGHPDADRDYSLKADVRRPPSSERAPSLRTCEKCFAIFDPMILVCPQCGHQNAARVARIRYVNAPEKSLEELQTERRERSTQDDRDAYWNKLQAEAVEKGYKPGWAKMKFKYRYGVWRAA